VDEKTNAVCVINATGTIQMANKVRSWPAAADNSECHADISYCAGLGCRRSGG
jgi:hypothetical protein